MKALFVHDHCFYVNPSGGAVYSSGKLPYSTWQRYLKEFDELVVLGRSRPITETQSACMNLSSGKGVSFVFVPNLASPWGFFRHRPKIIRTLKKHIKRVDAVIARHSLLGGLAASLARNIGKPCAVEAVGDAWDAYWNYGGINGKLYAPIAWFKMRHCLQKADFAIYVTREHLQRRYPCKGVCANVSDVEIIPVDDNVLYQKMVRWRSKVVNPVQSLKIGLIGSLVNRYKGLHVALRALSRLKEQGVLLELHVLGQGALAQWHEEAKLLGVASLLHLDGTLPSGEPVNQWLDSLDLYIQPSFQEGLPRALVEAMSRGLPALGSTCGGIPELLQPECLHRPGDDKTLAEQLVRMCEDFTWFISQAERNFYEARHYYSEEVVAKRSVFWSKFAEMVRRREQFT